MTSTCLYDLPDCECGLVAIAKHKGKVKRVVTVTLLALVAWSIMAMALIGGLVTYDRVANPQEDSGDLLLNCYIYGDGDCGPNAPFHGFVNIFW
jgi:hypothetical protein